ncbi:ferredoxin [Kitasatospora sp. NPDC092948]|uniref:ferredoxin n=1 Tax=Kitasatospora sp. NPDC092948 TaxID=3364088 RepID=UPI00381E1201
MALRILTDREKCCSSGQCAAALPAVFDQDPADGRVVLLRATVPAELAGAVREAVECCPTGAITTEPVD